MRALEKAGGGVEIGDDDIRLARTVVLELEADIRRVLQLLLDGAGPRTGSTATRSIIQDDKHVSRSHDKIASIVGDLGIPKEVERLTDDGYFSVDVYARSINHRSEFDS